MQPLHGGADLVLVAAALGLDGVGEHGLRERERRHGESGALVAERVARARVLELGDRAEVAGVQLGHVRLRLALDDEHVAESFGQRRASGSAPSRPT